MDRKDLSFRPTRGMLCKKEKQLIKPRRKKIYGHRKKVGSEALLAIPQKQDGHLWLLRNIPPLLIQQGLAKLPVQSIGGILKKIPQCTDARGGIFEVLLSVNRSRYSTYLLCITKAKFISAKQFHLGQKIKQNLIVKRIWEIHNE